MLRCSLCGLTAALALAAFPARAENLQLELINNSGLTLVEFYTSSVASPGWGEDILGASVVAPGSTGTVVVSDLDNTCLFDLQFVFEDGQVLEDQVDLCRMGSYTLQ